jgi:hypothetical protein
VRFVVADAPAADHFLEHSEGNAMSEIGRDAAHVIDHAGEIAQQVGGDLDKTYAAAKGFDWRLVIDVIVGLIAASAIVLIAVGVIAGLLWIVTGHAKAPSRPATPHPAPGDPGYLDWANQTGRYASPGAKPRLEPPQQPFRW